MASILIPARDKIVQDVGILDAIRMHIGHLDPDVRTAAAWLCTNLAFNDDELAAQRRELMINRGLLEILQAQISTDPNIAVRERCVTALDQFEAEVDALSSPAGVP